MRHYQILQRLGIEQLPALVATAEVHDSELDERGTFPSCVEDLPVRSIPVRLLRVAPLEQYVLTCNRFLVADVQLVCPRDRLCGSSRASDAHNVALRLIEVSEYLGRSYLA